MKSASSPSLPATLSHRALASSDSGDEFAISIDHWMSDLGLDSNSGYQFDFEPKPTLDSSSDVASFYDPYQNTSYLTPEWRWPFESHIVSASTYRPNAVARQSLPYHGHRRALSASTSDSHDTASPLAQPVSLPHSAGVDYSSQYLDPGYGGYASQPVAVPQQPFFAARVAPGQAQRSRSVVNSADASRSHAQQQQQHLQQQPQLMSSYPQNPQQQQQQIAQSSGRQYPKINTAAPSYGISYQEDQYNPSAHITSAPAQMAPNPQSQMYANSPYSARQVNTLSSRLQEANAARTSASPQQRHASPFRTHSPYAGTADAYGPPPMSSGAAPRSGPKAGGDRYVYDQHAQPDGNRPKTISPRDAVLDDFRTPGEEDAAAAAAAAALFPQGSGPEQLGSRLYPANGNPMQASVFGYALPSMPAGQQSLAKDFNYTPLALHQASSTGSQVTGPDYPAHLAAMESSRSEQEGDDDVEGNTPRPANVGADSGTYSCTYHGCTQRFATAAQLQKHKRDAHRPPNSHMQSPGGQTAAQLRNSQAGPHRCDRINPSTGKPCNTVFSRPYDLTRHEDTIHAQRMKVRCQYCTEEKTFSRSDALTRHMRVVHPNIDFPGKHRKRQAEENQ